MPKCSCGEIVKKDEIDLDSDGNTICKHCAYDVMIRITDKGLMVQARSPSANFCFQNTWAGIRSDIQKIKELDQPKPLPVVLPQLDCLEN